MIQHVFESFGFLLFFKNLFVNNNRAVRGKNDAVSQASDTIQFFFLSFSSSLF